MQIIGIIFIIVISFFFMYGITIELLEIVSATNNEIIKNYRLDRNHKY